MGYRDDFNSGVREARWSIFKILFGIVLPVFLVLSIGSGACYILSKPAAVLDQVTDPTYMVQNYNWFIQEDADIRKMDPQIAEAQRAVTQFETDAGPRDKWTFQDRDEHGRLTSVVTGLRLQRQDMVAAYNAKSDQKTRSFLKSHNLPDHYE